MSRKRRVLGTAALTETRPTCFQPQPETSHNDNYNLCLQKLQAVSAKTTSRMSATFNQCLLHKKEMFLLIVLSLVDFASSYNTEEVCYGSSYDVPIYYTPPLFTTPIYFKPKGEQKVLAVNEGKSVHKRFLVSTGSIKIKYLTKQDHGAMVYFGQKNSVKLLINDCQGAQESSYGDLFSWRIPYNAEYIDFSQMSINGNAQEPVVVWNRTDASYGRGTVKRSYYELNFLKQKDNGYYTCYGSTGDPLRWKRLIVKENEQYMDTIVGEDMELNSHLKLSDIPTIMFTPRDSGYQQEIDMTYTHSRMKLKDNSFYLYDVNAEDAGTYEFTDEDGFLALRVEINVEYPELPTWVLVVGGVGAVLFLFCCCCCVRKCCCKKSSNKRSSAETDAPRVFYHDSNQPSQPVAPILSREPRVLHPEPPTYSPAGGNVDLTPYTQVPVPGPERAPVAPTSSEPEPRFEFKGMVFPSAPPLSSSSNIQDVYSSDKLNFL